MALTMTIKALSWLQVEHHGREIDADFARLGEHIKAKMAVMEIVAQIRQVGIISGLRYTYDLRLSTATVTPVGPVGTIRRTSASRCTSGYSIEGQK